MNQLSPPGAMGVEGHCSVSVTSYGTCALVLDVSQTPYDLDTHPPCVAFFKSGGREGWSVASGMLAMSESGWEWGGLSGPSQQTRAFGEARPVPTGRRHGALYTELTCKGPVWPLPSGAGSLLTVLLPITSSSFSPHCPYKRVGIEWEASRSPGHVQGSKNHTKHLPASSCFFLFLSMGLSALWVLS